MDAVWDVLERIPAPARLADDGIDRVIDELARLPVARMVEFHLGVVELSNRALGWDLWEASDLISRGELSVDAYQDFRLWLIMLGREAYETALADPDSLAGHSAVQTLAVGPPGCLDLVGVAESAFDKMLDELDPEEAEAVEFPDELDDRPLDVSGVPAPADFRSPEGLADRLPRLVRLFGIPRSMLPRQAPDG
jgi:hypothetical protein